MRSARPPRSSPRAEESSMNRSVQTVVLGFLIAGLVGCTNSGGTGGANFPAGGAKRLTGGGSTFVEQMMKTWNPAYGKAYSVEVDYSGTGSGNGVTAMIDKKNDFGCTDAPMNDEQLKKAKDAGGDALHIPL